MTIRIAPSILSADFGKLSEQVVEVEAAGADWIHVDVMDGHFVPNLTIGPVVAEAVKRTTRLPVDVHLMIEAPERYIEQFAEAGADVLTVHQEACAHLHRTLQQIRQAGARAGVAINPATPAETLAPVLSDLDLVLVMSVNPGFGGQAFIPSAVDKVARVKDLLDEQGLEGVEIEVDGGIDESTAPLVVQAGATVLVAGSAIYRHPDGVQRGIAAIRDAIDPQ